MNIITISREFGSGGRELGKRLAQHLGWDYYDSEIIARVAKESGMDAEYLENTLSNQEWVQPHLTYRNTLSSAGYVQSAKVELLLKQKEVIEGIAARGHNCVIVGRNADVLLREQMPFNIFVCASQEAKVQRCRQCAPKEENLTDKELLRKMKQIDKVRSQTREILTGSDWGQRDQYHLSVNTTNWNIKELVPAVADFALRWFGREK